MPRYASSEIKGYTFENQTAVIRDGHIRFPKTDVTLSCRVREGSLRQIRVEPYHGSYLVCVCYDAADNTPVSGEHTCAIDFGVDNIMAVVSDTGESVLFKGGAVKEQNRLFNKRRGELVSIITKGHPTEKAPTSKRLDTLSIHRSEWMHDTFQKMSSRLIEWCRTNDVGTIVLGVSKGWKQHQNIGTQNNQNFTTIPFYTLQTMIRYKAERVGIRVEEQEESYTSKASFSDNDPIPVYGESVGNETFSGRRIHRGLYMSKDGRLINADINGAANILRKHGADTGKVSQTKLQSPLVIRQTELNKRIPVKGIEAA